MRGAAGECGTRSSEAADRVVKFEIDHEKLVLFDADGVILANLEAVHFQ